VKEYQYFYFSTKLGNNFQTMRYAFKSIGTASGNIELTGLEVVNTSSLTASDEKYLEKKALAWGLRYKK
jgi:hypothetical protein